MKLLYPTLVFCLLAATVSAAGSKGMKPTFADNDIFRTAYFLKNTEGLIPDYNGTPVHYFSHHTGVNAFFTDNVLIYRVVNLDSNRTKQIREDAEEEAEEKEGRHGKGGDYKPIALNIRYASVTWLGANPHPTIESIDPNSGYYTYLAGTNAKNRHSIVTQGYKKLIYHNLYPGIDVEYILPEKGGMEYSLTVHPGADLSRVKMQYGMEITGINTDVNGNIIIHTQAGDIVEHAPVSYLANGTQVASNFTLQGNVASFATPQGYDHNSTLIVDPWVNVLTQLPSSNVGTITDFDGVGNLYVYGAGATGYTDLSNFYQSAKFNLSGTNLWVFNGSVPLVGWSSQDPAGTWNYMSGMKVDRTTGKTYYGQGYAVNGAQVIRLKANGTYDSFESPADPNFREAWNIINNCITGDIVALGGGTSSSNNMGVINPFTAALTGSNITGDLLDNDQDIVSGAYDASGNLYVVMASGLAFTVNNYLFKANPAYNANVWTAYSGYNSFNESNNLPGFSVDIANNFNALAANGNYLYYYDGSNVAAFSLANGATVGTPYSLPYTVGYQGGIAVDNCDHLYVGGIGVIKTFTFNGSTFTPGADISLGASYTGDYVLDVRYNNTNNLLYVTGNQFVGTYVANNSATCTTITTFTSNVTPGCGTSKITVTPGAGLVNPVFSYLWEDSLGNIIRQTTPGTATTDSIPTPTAGQYTVQVQLNINCGGAAHTDTFKVVCNNISISPDTTICTGQSVKITALGLPAGGTYLWSPGGQTTASITVTPAANTTYYVTYTPTGGHAPITDSMHVTVTSGPTVTVNDTSICAGASANLTATPSVPGGSYAWAPGGGGTQTITVSPVTTTTYTVTYTVPHCPVTTGTGVVTISSGSITTVAKSICAGSSYLFNGQNLTAAGTYRDTVPRLNTCDSITVLTLTLIQPVTTPQAQSICNGSSYNFYGQSLTTAGTYRDTLTGLTGCDSIIVLTLSTLNPTTTPVAVTICNGSSYNFHGQILNAAGNYLDTLQNIYGCDSIISLTLSLINPTTTPVAQTICSNHSYNFYGKTLTTAGNYLDTLTSVNGCDSIISLTLTVIPTAASVLSQTICSNGSYTFGNNVLTNPGTYLDTLTGPNGCDSVVTLVLSVLPVSASNVSAAICAGDSFAFGGNQLHTAGAYLDTVTGSNGCDSVITLNLTVVPLPEAAFTIEPRGAEIELGLISVIDQSTHETGAQWQMNNRNITLGADGALPITDTGNYCVSLVAVNTLGCPDTAEHCVYVYNENLYVPSAFTPNGDGKNDVFEVFGSRKGMKYMSITIYDRWGEKVFESDDLFFTWDGRYRGVLEEPGVFVYVLNLTYLDNRSIQNKGSITLIR